MHWIEHCIYKFYSLQDCFVKPHISDALIRTLYAKVIHTEEYLFNTTYLWYID